VSKGDFKREDILQTRQTGFWSTEDRLVEQEVLGKEEAMGCQYLWQGTGPLTSSISWQKGKVLPNRD
jgi:hypothetical protein